MFRAYRSILRSFYKLCVAGLICEETDFNAKRIAINRNYFSFININDIPADIFSFYLINNNLI
jgi:hypothetical protein